MARKRGSKQRRRGERWTRAHVRRLFWRAGFGATEAEAHRWAQEGRAATLRWIVDGDGPAELRGPAPHAGGAALDPENEFGHHVLWWLDRMVRSTRPLEEKLTLVWHDHFATTGEPVPLMLRQNRTLREHALTSFPQLLRAVTLDPAMQRFLSLAGSHKTAPNENFARELMELFTLGSGYTEPDIREASRALTGWMTVEENGSVTGVRFDPKRHDDGLKAIFGQSGAFGLDDVLRLVVEHPRHPRFVIGRLWAAFHHEPLDGPTRKRLTRLYERRGRRIRPLVAAILDHPALYADLARPPLVKSPLVYLAGSLRTGGRGVDTTRWVGLLASMGQLPFHPPSVAGWDGGLSWLNTNAMRARFVVGNELLKDRVLPVEGDAAAQVAGARAALGLPPVSRRTGDVLRDLAGRVEDPAMRQRALRHLLLTGPDAQLH
jgi:uncharacterized protein (DUF1800 family)